MIKHQLYPPRVAGDPRSDLGVVVVIPCHDEPDLLTTLGALWACDRPPCAVEVLVVINAGEEAAAAVVERNRRTEAEARAWIGSHASDRLAFHLLRFEGLPARHAGVGLARKLGMDEAVARLHRAGNGAGVIAGLDADCRCAPTYLASVHRHFQRHPATEAGTVYFEHPAAGEGGTRLARGVLYYELFLRYHVHGLRFARSPYGFHTVGSCIAVRSDAYQRQGGMNRRQAGEDFYFLSKFMALGTVSEILDTAVYPAGRLSERTPFGTGRALGRWLRGSGGELLAYSPRIYRELSRLYRRIPRLHRAGPDAARALDSLPDGLRGYLESRGIVTRLAEIRANTATPGAFRKRFHRWFNGLETLKYIHWASDNGFPREPVDAAARTLLRWQADAGARPGPGAAEVLARYRELDRSGWLSPSGAGRPGEPRPGR